ncbi:helix-turn-helix domain-containing protein, partial [Acinetobacter baumannii]
FCIGFLILYSSNMYGDEIYLCNKAINKYIQLKRLEKVKADLLDKRNKQSSITQVALKWGFWDGAHFSKIFKKTYGISPKEFREGMSV